jgi:predicted nucleotidyltransferase
LKILNRHKAKYLIVGAYAVIYYTEPRYTKDLDIWIEPKIGNATRVYAALKEFGAPLKGINLNDFVNKNLVYQIGVEPIRVDIIMGIPGIEFYKAWQHREVVTFDGIKVAIIGISELMESKKRARRRMDAIDIENLRYTLKQRKGK